MLEQHPEIYMSPIKEPYYYFAQAFRNKDTLSLDEQDSLETFEKGGKYRTTDTYQSLFQDVDGATIVGEASHYLYHSDAAAAIFKDCPSARILVCLRNPVDRLFSEYLLNLRRGSETGSFADYVGRYAAGFVSGEIPNKINVPKLDKGVQSELLAPWIEQFGADRVKPILFDDLNQNPTETMKDIFRWLEIDESFSPQKIHAQKGGAIKSKWMSDVLRSQNSMFKQIKSLMPKSVKVQLRSLFLSKTLERPEIETETHMFLSQFYRDDVEKLSGIIGKDLATWCQVR